MKITKFRHENVLPNGNVIGGGSVHTEGVVRRSPEAGGCNLENCRCSEGHWITVVHPRTDDGIVEGVKVQFDNKAEMDNYLASH